MSEAQKIVLGLGGDWKQNFGLAPCPICQPEGRKDQRAGSFKDQGGKTLAYCHKSGCKGLDMLAACTGRGIITGNGITTKKSQVEIDKERQTAQRKAYEKLKFCDKMFAECVCVDGTPAQSYLETRGIKDIQGKRILNTMRFHPNLLHSRTNTYWPALVCRIRGPKGNPMGLHRTFLAKDGSDKAPVQLPKMMLGPSSSGAVRFGRDNKVIALAEGIETALSISRASRLTTWACLSTSGMKGLILPPIPVAEVVVICADNDGAGLEAAKATAARLEAEGRAVSVITPQHAGQDFNDVLRGNK